MHWKQDGAAEIKTQKVKKHFSNVVQFVGVAAAQEAEQIIYWLEAW